MHHYQNVQLGGELHTAPLSNPQRILDCGTGTGIWALDMGDRYPSAEVIGVDLSPIQPSWVAPNVRFEIDDLEKEWTFKENYFDFIHSRHMAMGIHDWKAYIQQVFSPLQTSHNGELTHYVYGLDVQTYRTRRVDRALRTRTSLILRRRNLRRLQPRKMDVHLPFPRAQSWLEVYERQGACCVRKGGWVCGCLSDYVEAAPGTVGEG